MYTTFDEKDRDLDYFIIFPEFPNDISAFQLSEEEILRALQSLNSGKGLEPDGIAPFFLKNLTEERAFNISLKYGKFPDT